MLRYVSVSLNTNEAQTIQKSMQKLSRIFFGLVFGLEIENSSIPSPNPNRKQADKFIVNEFGLELGVGLGLGLIFGLEKFYCESAFIIALLYAL